MESPFFQSVTVSRKGDTMCFTKSLNFSGIVKQSGTKFARPATSAMVENINDLLLEAA